MGRQVKIQVQTKIVMSTVIYKGDEEGLVTVIGTRGKTCNCEYNFLTGTVGEIEDGVLGQGVLYGCRGNGEIP